MMIPLEDDEDDERSIFDVMRSAVGESKARELAQELYGLGYWIQRRKGDLFDLAKAPPGVSYQWNEMKDRFDALNSGWTPVPACRHEGLYAPIGFDGPVEFRGMLLMERPQALTDRARLQDVAQAEHNEFLWRERTGSLFSGGVRVWTGDMNAPPPAKWKKLGEPAVAARVIASAETKIVPMSPASAVAAPMAPPTPPPPRPWWRRVLDRLQGKLQ